MRPILFIDRDGTIVSETEDEKVDKLEKLHFLPEVLYYLRKIRKDTPFCFVMVTNQDGLGTDAFPDHEFWPVHDFIIRLMKSEGISFDAIHIDPHFEQDNHPDRKPGTGMLTEYLKNDQYNLPASFVIGDRETDVALARNLRCGAIHLSEAVKTDAELTTNSWEEIYRFLTR